MIVDDPLALYLLMRTDLASLNPGKACAQAHHAAIHMTEQLRHMEATVHYNEWVMQAGQYGTVLTFGVDIATLTNVVGVAHAKGYVCGRVTDPTYPLRDGQVTHLLTLVTCGYVLCRKSQAWFLGNLQLMY